MLVSEILETVRPAYGESWETVFANFRSDVHEWRRIEDLMGEIRERGQQAPGLLCRHEADEDDPDTYLYLGNGTHRFAATVELGLAEFPVEEETEVEGDEDSFTATELRISLAAKSVSSEVREALDDCMGSSASFRVTDDQWAELVFMSSSTMGSLIEYTVAFTVVPAELHETFVLGFLSRIDCCLERSWVEYLSVGNVTDFAENFWLGDGRE